MFVLDTRTEIRIHLTRKSQEWLQLMSAFSHKIAHGFVTEKDFASQNFIAVVIQQKSVQGRYGIPAQQHPVGQDTPLNLHIKLLKA